MCKPLPYSQEVQDILDAATIQLNKATGMICKVKYEAKVSKNEIDSLINPCLQIWGVTIEYITEVTRTYDRVTMCGIISMLLYQTTPLSMDEIKYILNYKSRVSVSILITRSRSYLFKKDELFIKYYNPVKYLFNDKNV